MRAIASYILRGPIQAIMVSAISSVMSLIFPPLAHVSGASVALVTLRKGLKDGMLVLAVSGLILGLMLWLIGAISSIDSAMVKIYMLAMILVWWLPAGMTAAILRYTRSPGFTLLALGLLCGAAMTVSYLVIGDMSGWWREMLPAMLQPMYEATNFGLTKEELGQLIDGMSNVMTGFMFATIIYLTMINLFIARWLQSILFNPGGFRDEFHALKLDRRLAIILLIISAVSALTSGNLANYSLNLLILVMTLYSLQGLAIVYAVIAATGAHTGWLIALYIMMFFALPYAMLVLSITGFSDNWLDIRARVKKGGSSGPDNIGS